MALPLRLASFGVEPDELEAIGRAIEAEGGEISFREVARPGELSAIGPNEADVIVAPHRVGEFDARYWLSMRAMDAVPPVILVAEAVSFDQIDQLRRLGTFMVVPRGHPFCLMQAVRLAVGRMLPSASEPWGERPGPSEHRRLAGLMRVIGHNLRNVLGGLTNAVEVLTFQCAPEALGQRRTIELLDRQCRRMAGLLDDYSEIARMGSGAGHGTLELFELGELLRRAIGRTEQEATDSGVEFELVRRPDQAWIRVDGRRLEHLIRHGLHFCRRAARGCKVIRIDWRREGDRLELVFGLEPPASAFEAPRSGQAIDLDLFLATILADRIGGLLRPGPPFVIDLPAPISEAPGSSSSHPLAHRAATGPGRHVLLVDDSLESIQALGLLIGRLGWNVRATPNLDEAKGMIQAFRPEVVLIGLNMPFLDGESLARSIRLDVPEKTPLLIGISSSIDPSDSDPHVSQTFDHIVTKPVRMADLVEILGPPYSAGSSPV